LALEFLPVDDEASGAAKRSAEADRIANWDAEVCTNLMSTPQGRFMMERFLDYCCEGQELYHDDGDALAMAKRDGLAKAGRWWRIMLEAHCPDRLLQMIRERRSRMARAQAAVAAREATAAPAQEKPGPSPIEEMADEQQRLADEEAAVQRKSKPKKKS
jgi:hypothetical protein